MLPEVAPVIDVVEEENPRHPALPDRRHHAAEVEPQPLGDEDDGEDDRGDEADRLEHIDADDTLHSAEEGVDPDKGDRHQDIEEEGQPQRVKYQQLHRQHDEEDPHRGTEHLGDKEEPRSGLVARHPEAIPQVLIDGEELDAVEERHEDKGDQRLPHDEAECHLQVGHAAAGDHPRDGDKGDAADARANHRYRDDHPVIGPVSDEESRIVRLAPRPVGDEEHQEEVSQCQTKY